MNKLNFKESERLILAVDTSSKAMSLAVVKGAELLKSIDGLADEKRSERLCLEVQSLLAELGLTIADVDALAVCVGPGGFTGVRVGMAAVQGFALALKRPIVGVTSLEAAAFAAKPSQHVCALVNAYKREVYSQLFCVGGGDAAVELPVALNEPLVSTLEKALERIGDLKETIFIGDGAETGTEIIERQARTLGDVRWVIERSAHPVAGSIAQIAGLRYERGDSDSAESLKACYVRPSEAEIKLSLGLLGSKIKRSMRSQ